ncbi:hypothetical protein MC885_014926 [Smutsia gigantea]|nr:hypothetical protein MC885_014926 [Smutsia gigantea]
MVAATPFEPEKWEAHAAAGYQEEGEKAPSPTVGTGRPLYSQKRDQAPPSPRRHQQEPAGLRQLPGKCPGEEQGRPFLPTPRSRLDVTLPRGPAHPEPRAAGGHTLQDSCLGESCSNSLGSYPASPAPADEGPTIAL